MKIGVIGHKRIPGREGGIEVVVEELTKRMASKGHSVTVYNRKTKRIKKYKREYEGVKIVTVPTIEKKSTDAIIYSFLASIHALFCKYDIIHYHALGPSTMLLIPHIFGIKTVVTVHGLNYKTPKWKGLGAKVILLGEKITAKYADEIIVLSKEQQKYFKEKYGRETLYIPNGVSLGTLREPNEIKKKWNLKKKEYILFLSRVVPGKGLEHLIEAYKQVSTNVPLIIAGGSTFVDDFYESICKSAEQDDRIHLIGFVNGKTLEELYTNAALFVFPSEAEGMPMCLLEAMSYNVPCLVSDIPENIEVGKSLVQTFETANISDLKKELESALQNIDKERNSREFIKQNYDWDKIVCKTLKCYEDTKRKWH